MKLKELVDLNINVEEYSDKKDNQFFIGDNIHLLNHLTKEYTNKINIIYIDPPYNTQKKHFNYKDNREKDEWSIMIKEKLILSRQLLDINGIIFISIDNAEYANLKLIADEVFGKNNCMTTLIWLKKNTQNMATNFQSNYEYILVYAKKIKPNMLNKKIIEIDKENSTGTMGRIAIGGNNPNSFLINTPKNGYSFYHNFETKDTKIIYDYDPENKDLIATDDINLIYEDDEELIQQGYCIFRPPLVGASKSAGAWYWKYETALARKDQLIFKIKNGKKTIAKKDNRDYQEVPYYNYIDHISSTKGTYDLNSIVSKNFAFPKPVDLIKYLIKCVKGNENCLILDFFGGSGTTAHAVMELNQEDNGNRLFILGTNNENNIAYDITYERLHRLIYGVSTDNITRFKWVKSNKPFTKEKLRVFEIEESVD